MHGVIAPPRVQKLIVKARFDPKEIPAGHTLVLAAARAGVAARVARVHLIRGPAPACFPVTPPPLPPAALRSQIAGGRGEILSRAARGQVRCQIVRPAFSTRDGKRRVRQAPIVIRGARVTVTRVPNRQVVVPKVAPVKGKLPPPALLAARAARACAAASKAARTAHP